MKQLDIPYNGPAAAGHGTGSYPGLLAAAAALLAGLVYVNALHNPFVYDDYHTVVANASITDLTNLPAIVYGALTRPIVNLSYAVDRAVWGARPFGFHLTNVLLHMLNVVLLFQLARQLGTATFAAFAGAALFGVHPMMTEAVGYISGRSEVLCATFFMLALMSGRQWLRRSADRPYATIYAPLTVGLWFAALATKESAAMFPFVFLGYDWVSAGAADPSRRRRLWRVHVPLMAFALIAGIVRLWIFAAIEYPGQVTVNWSYVLLELDVVRRYVWMLLIPSGQALFHQVERVSLFNLRAWLALSVVGGLIAAIWLLRRRDWVSSVGLLWFLFVLVPSSALIVLDQGEPMAEHRVYLAACGVFLAVGSATGWVGRHWAGAPFVPAALFTLVLLSFSLGTVVRNAVWSDPIALWRESVELAPAHYRPRLLLGEALQDAGRRHEAVEQYQTAIRLRPRDPAAYVKAGQSAADAGRFAEARNYFLKAIEVDPGNASAEKALIVLAQIESRITVHDRRR